MGICRRMDWCARAGIVSGLSAGRAAIHDIALIQARAHHSKDVAFRLWATGHGRIYVPLSDKMSPDQNLSHIPERDIVTTSGQELTLINPAAITRQLNAEFGSLYGIPSRIVSRSPIHPKMRRMLGRRQPLMPLKTASMRWWRSRW